LDAIKREREKSGLNEWSFSPSSNPVPLSLSPEMDAVVRLAEKTFFSEKRFSLKNGQFRTHKSFINSPG